MERRPIAPISRYRASSATSFTSLTAPEKIVVVYNAIDSASVRRPPTRTSHAPVALPAEPPVRAYAGNIKPHRTWCG